VRVRAFAKINLSLRVLRRRPDGYHDLRTTFQSIALHDTLVIRKRRGPLRLTCDDPRVPVDAANLVMRAAAAVWKASGRRGMPHGLACHLVKRIPVAAGLGGGSADAAAALRVCGALWGVPAVRLRAIARRLGADVPYFLVGGTALGLGRGDVLLPLADGPRRSVVIAVPGFGVSTAEAYAWWDAEHAKKDVGILCRPRSSAVLRTKRRDRPATKKNPDIIPGIIPGNNLEPAVARRHPEIARLVARLRQAGASDAAMSGSGSAVFGLFKNRGAAAAAARMLPRRAIVTRTLTRAECRRLTSGLRRAGLAAN